MNIIIDVTRLVRRSIKGQTLTGIDRVSMAYIQHYKQKAQALVRWCGRSWVLHHEQSKTLFTWLDSPTRNTLNLMRTIISGVIFSNHNNPSFLLNTGHIGLGQKDYIRMLQSPAIKPIFFVHDLIPITYPEYSSAGEDQRYKDKINHILKYANAVIVNSETTYQDLITYAHETNQPMPQTQVALLASGISTAFSATKRPIAKPYFVILSTIEPRKNHLLLLHIWRQLAQELSSQAPHLVIIGYRGWECENVLDLLDRSEFLKNVITEIPRCSDQELLTYIRHSQALLCPSFMEGYGLPIIEALALGTPVIASDIPVFHEIAQNIPDYIDPLDGKRWKELIMNYTQNDSSFRTKQISRIQNFQSPTWANHFKQVDSFLEKL
jgi:glycosyltransferase involved in cell wall biosynthesis